MLEYVTFCVYGKFLTTHIFSLAAPPYHSRHKVQATNWSYATTNEEDDSRGTERYVDLSVPPPYKPPPEGYKVSAKDFLYYSQSSKKLKRSRGSQGGKKISRGEFCLAGSVDRISRARSWGRGLVLAPNPASSAHSRISGL